MVSLAIRRILFPNNSLSKTWTIPRDRFIWFCADHVNTKTYVFDDTFVFLSKESAILNIVKRTVRSHCEAYFSRTELKLTNCIILFLK